ncbi:hypothetical protein MMC21_006878 [Puttea exsequens]|nr:hypothetical protein [Puttea exsequens]
MVYLGVGVLVVSLSVLVYKYKISATWREKIRTESSDVGGLEGLEEIERAGISKEKLSIVLEGPAEPKEEPQHTPNVHQHVPAGREQETLSSPNQQPKDERAATPFRDIAKTSQSPTPSASSLMPPPPRPSAPSTFKPPSKPSTALRPPPSAASTLRAPPSRPLAPPSSSLAPSSSTLAPTARPSRKVLLDPGHSPLDWAHLTANPPTPNFFRGKDVPPQLIRVPPSLLRYHSGRKGKDAWGVYQGKVYNLSPYMKFHPGGVDQLMKGAGREEEGERLFNENHPWVNWENMLGECLVGILVGESEAGVKGIEAVNKMEEMD